MKNNAKWMRSLCWVVGLSFLGTGAFAQGSLTPPGAPAPSMKSLQDIYDAVTTGPIAVNSVNTPGDSAALYKITQPGSYYLTANIVGVSGKHGVQITTASVTLNLNGFYLIGVPGSNIGVYTGGSADRVTVVNGVVKDWGSYGVYLRNESLVADVKAQNNTSYGIRTNYYSIIRNCVARGNQSDGIRSEGDALITGCISTGNAGNGITIGGSGGEVNGCDAYDNGSNGILAGSGGGWVIRNNSCSRNTFNGISVCAENRVLDNVCTDNGSGVELGYGIYVRCGGNYVEGNICNGNDIGINALSNGGEVVVRNAASGNTTDYSSSTGNEFGPTGTALSTNPHTNISH
ncbi:MAG: right-handed parallel beta-helix repeat-containing protein [bacterium]